MYEKGCLSLAASGRNLSGMNFSGSGNISGFLCTKYGTMTTLVLGGTT